MTPAMVCDTWMWGKVDSQACDGLGESTMLGCVDCLGLCSRGEELEEGEQGGSCRSESEPPSDLWRNSASSRLGQNGRSEDKPWHHGVVILATCMEEHFEWWAWRGSLGSL